MPALIHIPLHRNRTPTHKRKRREPDEWTRNLDQRAKTLSALDAFIASQRALLARSHDDIERLRGLKGDVVRDPEAFFDNVDERLGLPVVPPKRRRRRVQPRLQTHDRVGGVQWVRVPLSHAGPLGIALPPSTRTSQNTNPLSLHRPNTPPHPPVPSLPRAPPSAPSLPLPQSSNSSSSPPAASLIDPVLIKFPPPTPLSDSELAGLGGCPVNAEEEKTEEGAREDPRAPAHRAGGGEGTWRTRVSSKWMWMWAWTSTWVRAMEQGSTLPQRPRLRLSDPLSVGGGIKEGPMDVDVGEGVSSPPPPPSPSKFQIQGQRTTTTSCTPHELEAVDAFRCPPPPPSIAAVPIASASTSTSASRPAKRAKVKHQHEEEEEEGDEGEEEEEVVVMHDPYGGASTKGKAASSTPPSPYNGYGGKSVEAVSMGRVGSMPSVGGKSLEALGLGGKAPPTSVSGQTTKSKDSGGSRGAKEPKPEKEKEKEKGTREKKEKTRPETYKQAWSVEEQRLLEQLLEEIPEGEGFRQGRGDLRGQGDDALCLGGAVPPPPRRATPALADERGGRGFMAEDIESDGRTEDAAAGGESGAEVFREVEEVWGWLALIYLLVTYTELKDRGERKATSAFLSESYLGEEQGISLALWERWGGVACIVFGMIESLNLPWTKIQRKVREGSGLGWGKDLPKRMGRRVKKGIDPNMKPKPETRCALMSKYRLLEQLVEEVLEGGVFVRFRLCLFETNTASDYLPPPLRYSGCLTGGWVISNPGYSSEIAIDGEGCREIYKWYEGTRYLSMHALHTLVDYHSTSLPVLPPMSSTPATLHHEWGCGYTIWVQLWCIYALFYVYDHAPYWVPL
ncbi:hypothetical protein FA13DRAFT_1773640 [Coprinellus micaceus]|uniref:Uncharacterized protein n=1 Tax=Coprinellus micaceus TaxID=71717 RepID=A0A4Y7TFC1_COPMI|nr:hypothetical protein FA13DRAFT_1773640 [Coprinellus micaceus]